MYIKHFLLHYLYSSFISLKQQIYNKNLINTVYKVKSDGITALQLEKARKSLDTLLNLDNTNEQEINKELINLYTIIPRNMQDVRKHLIPKINLSEVLKEELETKFNNKVEVIVPNSKQVIKF